MPTRIEEMSLSALGVCLIILMLAIVAQVVCSALDLNPVIVFDSAIALAGEAITLNSLLDFQWHLLVIVGLTPAGLVWMMDRHVRVDFLHQRQSRRVQARIDLLGNALFAAPFFALSLPAAWSFLERAWASDEGSRNAGLNDLWLIKAVLPFGLGLLALAVLLESWRLRRDVW
ncbi:MAG: TRAP transporter small permease subunit [Pseudomonadota bacterium]